jgi:transmembrane sensor
LQSEEASGPERAEFIDWLRESPLHVAELLHACRLQRDLSAFPKWHEIKAHDQQDSPVVRLRSVVNGRRSRAAAVGSFLRRHGVLATASVLAVAALSAAAAIRLGQTVITTQWGERREVTLADGSIVDLAPSSDVRVRLLAKRRLVSLNRGEALFHVAKNPKRPFIVTADNTSVRAVGTAFDVARRAGGVAVTVVEGRVSVTTQASLVPRIKAGRGEPPIRLSLGANQQVVVSSSTGDATPVRQVQGEAEVAWATNQLDFDNEPVAEVASRFNLYNHTQIRVLDQALAARRVSGSFRTTDPESFVAFIKSVAGVTIVRQDHDTIVLGTPPQGASAPKGAPATTNLHR